MIRAVTSNGTPIIFSNASNPPKTTILAEFVGTKQRWSCYPVGVKIRPLTANSSRPLDQFVARATQKIALRHRISVSRSERPLRPTPATAPRCIVMSVSRVRRASHRGSKNWSASPCAGRTHGTAWLFDSAYVPRKR